MAIGKVKKQYFHMHLVSDSTGETLNTVARAATVNYSEYQPLEHIYALVRTQKQLSRVISEIERQPGIVLFTLVEPELRTQLETTCNTLQIPCISILDPVITSLATYLNTQSRPQVAAQHQLNAGYFKRIEAINYTIAHDDGQHTDTLDNADVILIGISRTSKTPTGIYLAHRGVKTANIPIVPNIDPPKKLFTVSNPLIVSLTASADRISQIRRHRLLTLKEQRETSYIDKHAITQELLNVKKLCNQNNWPTIDVTRRSVEETAAAILNLLNNKKNHRIADEKYQ